MLKIFITFCFLFLQALLVESYRSIQIKLNVQNMIPLKSSDKIINYEEDATLCLSEGGKWSKEMTDSLGDIEVEVKKPKIFSSDPSVRLEVYVKDLGESISRVFGFVKPFLSMQGNAENLVKICDAVDSIKKDSTESKTKDFILRWKRYFMLTNMLQNNREEYLAVTQFLNSRIPREEFPNLQEVPYPIKPVSIDKNENLVDKDGAPLVEDCRLEKVVYEESFLDKTLLKIFRSLVQKEIDFKSEKEGILGLLEEGQHFKLSEKGEINDSKNQHIFVKNVLAGLLTPFLPPFYRIFMSGVVPSVENKDPKWLVDFVDKITPEPLPPGEKPTFDIGFKQGKQYGPWFYAPALTSVVTPPFMRFLLGPCKPNRRSDGKLGGMLVEKCKFLQESNCKGLCLHQCKIPAQEFFSDTLKVPLTVSPNFETQECQWSWGEVPLPHGEDPTFPKGCISGCETRLLANS